MPAYVVSRLSIRDRVAMGRYIAEAPATVHAYEGKYLVRGSDVQALEGTWDDERIVIVEFPSVEAALAWYQSDVYRPLREIRQRAADAVILLVAGAS
jgi:uncharacterized protein (DUF1330 family)